MLHRERVLAQVLQSFGTHKEASTVLGEAQITLWGEGCSLVNYIIQVVYTSLIVVSHMLLPNVWMIHQKIIKATVKIY